MSWLRRPFGSVARFARSLVRTGGASADDSVGSDGVDRSDRGATSRPFGAREIDIFGNPNDQWRFGANRLTDMACCVSDDLSWWFDDEEGAYVVRNSAYEMERREDDLWLALWILERDVRVEYGTKFHFEDDRRRHGGDRGRSR